MENQKQFQKKKLNSEDRKGKENGAKVVKGFGGFLGAALIVAFNKDNLKGFAKNAISVIKTVNKR